MTEAKTELVLDGDNCTLDRLRLLSTGKYKIALSDEAWERVRTGRAVVDKALESGAVVYGVNTGFGNFATVQISPDQVNALQLNLIRSHCAGVGEPLPIPQTRVLLALRINTVSKGFSGIREESLRRMIDAFNADCLSRVPQKGTLGASGDLAPLSHLALGLIGEGQMWDVNTGKFKPAAEVLKAAGVTPVELRAKEGLAMINGTQMITALGSEAAFRAARLLPQADVVAAMTLEALKGSVCPFDERISAARPHAGQQLVARRMRALLAPPVGMSEISCSHAGCKRVQDSYTLRCTPQVHGIVNDTVQWVSDLLSVEMNSATDNPMVMVDTQTLLSGGNFHAEYPAKACDYLAIGIHELAQISERRIERLVNATLSELPPFLVKDGGLNSGFMIAHCTAASLVSENKVLCHPSSVDSISTSAAKEDHVSMGGFAARKAVTVVEHVETVVAIELLCACQAVDFLRPLKTTPALEAVHALVRQHVPHYDSDRYLADDIETAAQLLRDNKIWEAVAPMVEPLLHGSGMAEVSKGVARLGAHCDKHTDDAKDNGGEKGQPAKRARK